MLNTILAASLLCAAPAPAAAPAPQSNGTGQAPVQLPVANGQLVLAIDDAGLSMTHEQLVDRYAELTGVSVTFSEDTEGLLRSSRVRLDAPLVVEPADVPRVAESLLQSSGYVLGFTPSATRPLLEVASVRSNERATIRSRALAVTVDQLDALEQHPAMMFSLMLDVPNLDPRQLSNSLRTVITDSNVHQLLPAGQSNSLILIGQGNFVTSMARTLMSVDAAAGRSNANFRATVRVVRLEHAEVMRLAGILDAVFSEPSKDNGPRRGPVVMPDQRTNSLVLRGSAADVEQMLAVVAELDREVD
ncbi:MAG: secretin N-terminal domain-containing protein [Planctomycetota bacterium]